IDLSAEGDLRLVSLKGGTVSNAVPDSAKAVIEYNGKRTEITAKGVSAHASTPELGTNAISVIFDLMADKTFAQDDVNDIVGFFKEHLGFDIHGERMEIPFEDEPSGKLSLNVGIVDIEYDLAKLVIDVRYPVTFTLEQVMEGVHKVCDPFGWEITENTGAGPLYKPADDPLVVTLMDIYRKYTGQKDAQPITMGGATYARAVPNTVAFGPVFPGEVDLCHQPNEYIDIETMVTSTKIFAEALYQLAK
ncbi:MAG: M20/M25/M40 family metallo-hydrolase, partial [Firmicutes bacterium]|nr:M20/M25/M40 family metallo-hydrolase [Bacillota bacterium]